MILPLNNHIHITPLKKGMLGSAGQNEYEVADIEGGFVRDAVLRTSDSRDHVVLMGDIVIVEPDIIIRTLVDGKEELFIKESDIIAKKVRPDQYSESVPAAEDAA